MKPLQRSALDTRSWSAAPAPGTPQPALPGPRRRYWRWVLLALLIALPIVTPTFTLHRARAHILLALQQGLGRRVGADGLHIVLLPWPGIELDNLRVGDDRAFGIEDMVIADDARATLQLRSLLRDRIVFSSLHLDSPHINLVRDAAGNWNFAGLLNGAAAPARHGGAPAATVAASRLFPYIEWSDARVNFKLNEVKERFYLDNVRGSLARESGSWRLQAQFEPQRTDLNLSDAGDVTLEGRWSDSAAGFSQAPFVLNLHLTHAYLQATSALVAGHDAGVHGIASADMQLRGNGSRIDFSGDFGALALRRWDLLPPPAAIAGSFSGDYLPGADRLELRQAGDRGFHHVRLSGAIDGLLGAPKAALQLQLTALPVAALLPLARAMKAGLPRDLSANGQIDGGAQFLWNRAAGVAGTANMAVSPVRLSAAGDSLQLAATHWSWDGHQLAIAPALARLTPAGGRGGGARLRLGAQIDARGYALSFAGTGFDAAAAQALAHLCALPAFWPAALRGAADVNLRATAPWSQFRRVDWLGDAAFANAVFAPAAGPRLPLTSVIVDYAAGEPPTVHFSTMIGGQPLAGWVQPPPNPPVPGSTADSNPTPLRFQLQAAHLDVDALWRLLHPSPDLLARALGQSDWLSALNANGAVSVADISWRDYHAALEATLTAQRGIWQAPTLQLRLGSGLLRGAVGFDNDAWHLRATAARADLTRLLAPGPYRQLLAGTLDGDLRLDVNRRGVWGAAGQFQIRNGAALPPPGTSLAVAATDIAPPSSIAFTRLQATFTVSDGTARLAHLSAHGATFPGSGESAWTGAGTLQLDRDFVFNLLGAQGEKLSLAGPLPIR